MSIKEKIQRFISILTGEAKRIDDMIWQSNKNVRMIADLEKHKIDLYKECETLKNKNHELVAGMFKEHNDCVAIDFHNPNITIFSIERLWDVENQYPYTCITVISDNKFEDQFFDVSDDKHKALVVEFNSSLATKRVKGK